MSGKGLSWEKIGYFKLRTRDEEEATLISEGEPSDDVSGLATQEPRRRHSRIRQSLLLGLLLLLIVALSVYLKGGPSMHSPPPPPPSDPNAISELPHFPNALNATETAGNRDWIAERERTSSENLERMKNVSEASLRDFFRCRQEGNCRPNQEKLVIINEFHWHRAVESPLYITGEQIWARSANEALKSLNYTIFYHFGTPFTVSKDFVPRLPNGWDDVHMMISGADALEKCAANSTCVYSKTINKSGVRIWKTLSFHYWQSVGHPLDHHWVLSPEPWDDSQNMYLGYSIEAGCMKTLFINPEERYGSMTKAIALNATTTPRPFIDPLRRVAYVLAKNLSLFGRNPVFGAKQFQAAYDALNIRFEIGSRNDLDTLEHPEKTDYLKNATVFENHAQTPPHIFNRILSTTRILIGIGEPATSPSPYDALCLGIPFLNPILEWNKKEPQNRLQWNSQHNTLKHLDPPYVYNVFRDDTEGFVDAIRSALANPIGRFVRPAMRQEEVTHRLETILSRDHRALMRHLMDERVRRREGKIFDV